MTLRNAMRGHGRLLAVLSAAGQLDPAAMPAARLTPEAAALFVRAMRAEGNANSTIKVRLFDLHAAMKIMQPEVDMGWLIRPSAHSLHVLLPIPHRRVELIGADVLYRWAIRLAGEALAMPPGPRCWVALRNAVILGLFASRAPRLASMAAMRLGYNLERIGEGFGLTFGGGTLKTGATGRRLRYGVPPELEPYMKEYLANARPALLNGGNSDHVWINELGRPLDACGIEVMVWRASGEEYDPARAFRPHHFRHELASSLAEKDPDNPGLAAAILGVSLAVAKRYYNHARQVDAARRVVDHLEAEMERTKAFAQRLFEERPRILVGR
ncbi:MAG: hypothetical protein KGL55_13365 [Rhodospirillales bacterium]|nr:hypothetical protein [Rhodospirillales bacterium]